jgi:hypothetical protein
MEDGDEGATVAHWGFANNVLCTKAAVADVI